MHKSLLLALFTLLLALPGMAKEEDVINSDKPITWLGLDFSLARFIGDATQFSGAGEVSLTDIREKYIPAWNTLFINEPKKYDVAKWVKRETVSYALDVVAKNNLSVGKSFFSQDPSDLVRLQEGDIAAQVRKMNFNGRHGVGYVIFIEGMSKGAEQASGWITFVDMDKKTMLYTRRAVGKTGGIGFRNYWASAFLNILKKTRD